MLDNVSTTLSELTHYTSIAVTPDISEDTIKDIEFILLGSNNLMAIIFTECGVIKEAIIKFEEPLNSTVVEDLKYIFKKKLIGKPLSYIDGKVEDYILSEVKISVEIIKRIIIELNRILEDRKRVYLKGTEKTIKLPELRQPEKMDSFLHILENKEKLTEVINSNEDGEQDISIYIGAEDLKNEGIKGYSIVTLSHKEDGKDYGTIGIIGPQRMNYGKVMSILKTIAKERYRQEKKDKKGEKDE